MYIDNDISWGEIYEVSWWGVGVDNNIGWGIIYQQEAEADTWSYQVSKWNEEDDNWDYI
jgi:hypothetical protein